MTSTVERKLLRRRIGFIASQKLLMLQNASPEIARFKKIRQMMKRMKSHSGFSITEVVVAALIFMIVAAGTFSVFSMARQQSVASDKEIIATYRGHELLESLRAHVDARSWDHDDWAGLTCDPQGDAVTRDWPGQTHQGYPIQYQCELFADGFLRKVTVIVPWDD